MRFRLVIDDPNRPLLTGGRYSEMVVKAGLLNIKFSSRISRREVYSQKFVLNKISGNREHIMDDDFFEFSWMPKNLISDLLLHTKMERERVNIS